ncbi:hypothetical protein DPMN_165579 [Dreissena polymorpha]|uniref:Uncharacterized protein n=1 Tax=Dreissena polymorpha TaxID=45954 RepID=A0A9D4F0J4_DREPO|nr:hypothetical protein DPMN_165579 [Dreissena polymorpha]
MTEPSGKIARWIEIVSPFDFRIEYRPGKKQAHFDALSMCGTPRDCSCDHVDMSEPLKYGPYSKCQRRAEMMLADWRLLFMEQRTEKCEQDGNDNILINRLLLTRVATNRRLLDTPSSGTLRYSTSSSRCSCSYIIT